MENKNKAAAALAISAAGAAATIPSISPFVAAAVTPVGTFILNLLNHGFLAATVGGMADWFAVTALFRKPLGISYRTEILKRSRGRIMEAIVEFVSADLLSAKNIMKLLQEENTAQLLTKYLSDHGGRAQIKNVLNELLIEIALNLDTKTVAKNLTPLIENEAQNINAAQMIDSITGILTKDKHSRRILSLIFETGEKILKSEPFQAAMLEKIGKLLREYEGDSSGRAFVLSAVGLTDEKILAIINENVEKKVGGTLKTLRDENGIVDEETVTTAANMTMIFGKFIKEMSSDLASKNFIKNLKNYFTGNVNLTEYVKNWLDKNLKGETYLKNLEKKNQAGSLDTSRIIKMEKVQPEWTKAIENLADEKIDGFIKSPLQQEKFDRFIKKMLEKLINEYHSTIPQLIHERLDKLSDEELTKFVENKISDDLQMIRINGSICGAVVGMTLYAVSYVIGRLCGA